MADRLSDKKKKEIIAYYVECQNYSETGRKFKVSEGTVRNVVKKERNITKKCEQKNEENIKSVLEAMEERKEKKVRILNKILDAIENKTENIDMFTNIKDLATAYGIILDKEIKIKELDIRGKDNKDALEKLDALLEAQKNA